MSENKIVNKIKKLLALGTSSNENEARAALAMAAKLAKEHGLAVNEIDQETGEILDVLFSSTVVPNNRYKVWEGNLAGCISKCFECKIYRKKCDPSNGRVDLAYVFVGTETDTEMANWYFRTIRMKIIRSGKMKFKLVKDQKTYGIGASVAIITRLRECYIKVKEEIQSSDCKALVVCKIESAEKAINTKIGRLSKNHDKFRISGSSESYNTGKRDGESMSIHKNVA